MAGERERERERAARIMGHWRPAGQHHVSVTRGRIIAEQTAIVNVRPIATTGPTTNSSGRNSSCCETTSTFTVSLNDFNRPPTRSLPRVVSDSSETYYRRVNNN